MLKKQVKEQLKVKKLVKKVARKGTKDDPAELWRTGRRPVTELDEIIAEIDSDKATFELTAEASGNLIIEAEEGTTLEIGKLICKIEIKEISKEKKESQDQKEVLPENKSES